MQALAFVSKVHMGQTEKSQASIFKKFVVGEEI